MRLDERGTTAMANRDAGITSRTISYKGNFDKTNSWLQRILRKNKFESIFKKYGDEGVKMLEAATPVRSGLTSKSWEYELTISSDGGKIEWNNTNEHNGFNVAISIQYGHGTRNGGYVTGIDYINPALKPIFEKLTEELWEEVKRT